MNTTIHRPRNRGNDRLFYVLWAGQLLSGLGSGMTTFAIGVYIFLQTGRVSEFSYVVLAFFLPSILLKPLTGILADRVDRRLLMAVGDTGALLSVLTLVTAFPIETVPIWAIYIIVALGSSFSSLREPAYKASITDLIGRDRYSRAAGMVQLATSTHYLLAPVIAGALLSVQALPAILVIDSVTFGIAILSTVIVFVSQRSLIEGHRKGGSDTGTRDTIVARRPVHRLIEGWRAITENRKISGVVIILAGTTFFVGLLQTLLHPMLLSTTTPEYVGVVQSLSAVGMITSSLVLGTVFVTKRYDRMLRVGLFVTGGGMFFLGLTANLIVSGIALFVFFAALPFVNTSADVIIRSGIPNSQQGRAWGFIGLLSQVGYILAYLSAGVLADRIFEPLFIESGLIAETAGRIFGVGPGRGIGVLVSISGIGIAVLARWSEKAHKKDPDAERYAPHQPSKSYQQTEELIQ